jgi:hypothetical protein
VGQLSRLFASESLLLSLQLLEVELLLELSLEEDADVDCSCLLVRPSHPFSPLDR